MFVDNRQFPFAALNTIALTIPMQKHLTNKTFKFKNTDFIPNYHNFTKLFIDKLSGLEEMTEIASGDDMMVLLHIPSTEDSKS